jgi:predicted GNAT family acetyltransferase
MTRTGTDDPEVFDNSERHRYEIESDGNVAGFVDYAFTGHNVTLIHTEIDEASGGKGLASRLIKAALDDIRRQHKAVRPTCSFAAAYIGRHPEYADLVAGATYPPR